MSTQVGGPWAPAPRTPRPGMLRPVLIAGAVFGVFQAMPVFPVLNLFCCMPVLACGALAAWLHGRALLEAGAAMTTALGAGVGALAGVVSGLVSWLVSASRLLMAGSEAPERLEDAIRQTSEMLPFGRDGLDALPGGWPLVGVVLTVQLFFNVILFGLFATLGGVIGGAIMEKQKPAVAASASDGEPPPPRVFE